VSTGGGCIDSRVGVDRGQTYRQQSGCRQVGVSTGGGYINNRVSISTGGGCINGRAGVSTGGGCIDSRAGVDRGQVSTGGGCRQGVGVSTTGWAYRRRQAY